MKIFKNGFTLAEVLITLAIIGVVAALTLPTLMSNYRKKEVETKLQKFYATMQQAIKLSTVDNGPTTEWPTFGTSSAPTSTPETLMAWFNKYLAPYVNFSSVEPFNGGLLVKFQDGSRLIINDYVYDMTYQVRDCNENCKFGVNQFFFQFKTKAPTTFQPKEYAWDGTMEGAKYSKLSKNWGCYESSGYLCTKLIQLNGWKIPDDYPYHF